MNLQVTKRTIFEVEYGNLEEFVESKYGGRFCFISTHEATNDNVYEFTVKKGNMNNEFNQKDAEKIRQGDYPMYSVGKVFNVMADDGFIEEGTYMVDVCY